MKPKTIVLTGGGSGGHITPILAVAAEIKKLHPEFRLVYIGQRGDALGDIPAQDEHIDEVFTVRAGKFRRYHGEGLKQLLDIPTMLKNIRDALYVLIGIFQSWRILGHVEPDVIFSRGGFVSVPVALGGLLRHIPYITHDSDPVPSLANRIIARWAVKHAVAWPKDIYPYPPEKTVTTGIPLQTVFVPVTPELRKKYRQEIDIPAAAKLVFIIGGGLGAQRINASVSEVIPHLLHEYGDLYIVHGVGRANEASMKALYNQVLTPGEQERVRTFGYLSDVYRYSGAADLIITRAGATNLAEFATQGKACIVIPSPFLTGGHQLKNASYLQGQNAVVVLDEVEMQADPNRLAKQVSDLLKDPSRLRDLGEQLSMFAKPNATRELADLIVEQATPVA
jgi:UDP-N-acetylglucosamine--N-acetylmuramyl-(pentapeptide) pyrophosphoryl-undecaprenol N-acetylglucosamine transferase